MAIVVYYVIYTVFGQMLCLLLYTVTKFNSDTCQFGIQGFPKCFLHFFLCRRARVHACGRALHYLAVWFTMMDPNDE